MQNTLIGSTKSESTSYIISTQTARGPKLFPETVFAVQGENVKEGIERKSEKNEGAVISEDPEKLQSPLLSASIRPLSLVPFSTWFRPDINIWYLFAAFKRAIQTK